MRTRKRTAYTFNELDEDIQDAVHEAIKNRININNYEFYKDGRIV
jgi:hypothetical protein